MDTLIARASLKKELGGVEFFDVGSLPVRYFNNANSFN